jgi:PAS domain S-box-containing protein
MTGNVLYDLFQGQMDYIFFFKGLAFFLVLAVSFLFRADSSQRLPWHWFGLFALAQGLAAWVSLASMNMDEPFSLKIAGTVLLMISWLFLTEFGRAGMSRVQGRDSGFWLLALILMVTALGGLKGWSGIEVASRYTLGLVGGLWATAALVAAGRQFPAGERSGSLTAAISLGLFSLTSALFLPGHLLPASSTFHQDFLLRSLGVPLEFCQGLLAFGMAAGIYGFLPQSSGEGVQRDTRYRTRYLFALLASLALILGLGSALTLYLGQWAQTTQEKTRAEAQGYAAIVVNRLNTEFKRMEDGVRGLAESPQMGSYLRLLREGDLDKINTALDRVRDNLGASVCYLMDRGGDTIASSNRREPDSFVGKNYAFRPYFKDAFHGEIGRYFAMGVTSKVPGYYVSHPVYDPQKRTVLGVAVVKVSLDNITKELQAAGQKGNSLICLVDPRGVIFLSSQPEMIFKSLWPIADKDRVEVQRQYGKDQFTPIFPKKVEDGSKLDYQGRNYLASFAGTIHAGWSVFFFRPVEIVGAYRFTGIVAAGILALLVLVILGGSFYLREKAAGSAGQFQTLFDAAPEAIGVVDPDTLRIVEANRSMARCLGYAQKELLTLRLDDVLAQTTIEIRDQLREITRGDGSIRLDWRARKQDGTFFNLDVVGSRMEHRGKDHALLFCREAETPAYARTAPVREDRQYLPTPQPELPSVRESSRMYELSEAPQDVWPPLEGKSPDDPAAKLDREAKKLLKRIGDALAKAEKIRKGPGDFQG